MSSGKPLLKMALCEASPHAVMSSTEKVRSWMASTSGVQQVYPHPDEPDVESMHFELTHHPLFIEDVASTPRCASRGTQRRIFIPRKTTSEEVSCASIFKKYLPAHASDGSKLVPGFLKTVRRRQSIALLRKHAFRWATISAKKFVMIRTDGCNMVPWTDVNEYFFPLCDDPSCEIVLLALKYAMGYPKMIRHIHPCSQREQLRFGDLFKVVSFGTILVDIDAVLSNKAVLWNLVEEMHSSCNPGLTISKCSYRNPENKVFPRQSTSRSDHMSTFSQQARANSPWDGVMDFQSDEQDIYIQDSKSPDDQKIKFETDHNSNIVEFLGEQANLMFSKLSKEKLQDARSTKSWHEVSPKPNVLSAVAQNDGGKQSTEQRPFSAMVQRRLPETNVQEEGLFHCSSTSSAHKIHSQKPVHSSGQVVALRVNNSRLLPVVLPGEDPHKAGQDLNKWLVPIYLLQSLCLNAHVTGKLASVYRDFIVGRACKTPGGKGYARLCTRQEGRDLTRWLFFMSEKASLIPTWTIVTSRCLLMQWRDFLQHLPGDMIQTFEIDLSLSVHRMGRQDNHGPIDSKDAVSNADKAKFGKVLGESCQLVKKCNKYNRFKSNAQSWPKLSMAIPLENGQLMKTTNSGETDSDCWYPSADWTTQLLEEPHLPFPELKDCAEDNCGNGPLISTDVHSSKEEYPVPNCESPGKVRSSSATGTTSKLPCIVGHRCEIQSERETDGGIRERDPMWQCSADADASLDISAPGRRIAVKTREPMKGRKYNCKTKPGTNDNAVWTADGRWTGMYNLGREQSNLSADAAQEGNLADQRGLKRCTRYSAKNGRKQKEDVEKTSEKVSPASVKDIGETRRTVNQISAELINDKSYEKYVHRRIQVEDGRSDMMNANEGSSKLETLSHNDKPVGDSKETTGLSPEQSSDQSDSLASVVGNDLANAELPKKTTDNNNEKFNTPRPRNPSLRERREMIEESDVPVHKNHFEGLTLWSEEDEVPELSTYLKPSKANSQPLKQCLKTEGKKPPSKTVSWHIPGVYPKEERTGNLAADEDCPKPKPNRSILKCKEDSKAKTTVKTTKPKPAESKPRPPEPGGDFKTKTKCNETNVAKTSAKTSTNESKGAVTVKIEPPDLDNSSPANVEPSHPEKLPLQINTKDSKDLTKSEDLSIHDSSPRSSRKVVVQRAVKAENLIFSATHRSETMARIYTGSPTKQQELIAKRVSLGRKHVQSDSKIPQLRKTRASSGKSERGQGSKATVGAKSSEQVGSKGKRSPIKTRRKMKTVTKSECCDTVLTAWEVKQEPGTGSEIDPKEDKKSLHGDLHCESTFKVPVDRTQVVKSCSIVQQQQKLLEAIQKKTKATPRSSYVSGGCGRKPVPQHGVAAVSCTPVVGIKQEPPDVALKTYPTAKVENANVCKEKQQNSESLEKKDVKLEPKVQYSFEPQFDPDQTVSNRGLVVYEDLVLPYVSMNGYKYVTLVDATRVFSLCQPNCRLARSLLRSHRALHRTMCSWEQVYGFELTEPNKKPPVRTGDMLVRFDTLVNRLPILENELRIRHKNSKAKVSQKCGYSAPS